MAHVSLMCSGLDCMKFVVQCFILALKLNYAVALW